MLELTSELHKICETEQTDDDDDKVWRMVVG